MNAQSQSLRLILPVYNQAGLLPTVLSALQREVLGPLISHGRNVGVIVVDDGSTDGSETAALSQQHLVTHLKVIRLTRHYGRESAVLAGVHAAGNSAVIIVNPELPEFNVAVNKLVDHLDRGGIHAIGNKGLSISDAILPCPAAAQIRLINSHWVRRLSESRQGRWSIGARLADMGAPVPEPVVEAPVFSVSLLDRLAFHLVGVAFVGSLGVVVALLGAVAAAVIGSIIGVSGLLGIAGLLLLLVVWTLVGAVRLNSGVPYLADSGAVVFSSSVANSSSGRFKPRSQSGPVQRFSERQDPRSAEARAI
ncbi:glycosyltransferase, partial [bacterium]|nr:glycosyltransferase [bacterium]